MTDLETAARKVFETTRNHLGHAVPTWEDLPEQTRQVYRDFVAARTADDMAELQRTYSGRLNGVDQ